MEVISLKQKLRQEQEQQNLRERRNRLKQVRKAAGVENEDNEWECLTTDYRGYPMAIKRSRVEGFSD